MSGKKEFDEAQVTRMFTTNSLMNYMNDLYLNAFDMYMAVVYGENTIKDPMSNYATYREKEKIPAHLNRAMKMYLEKNDFSYSEFNLTLADVHSSLAHKFDVVYLFTAERLQYGTFNLMLEPLTNYDVFEVDQNNRNTYFPLIAKKYGLSYFELDKPFYHRRYEKYIDPDLSKRHKAKTDRL